MNSKPFASTGKCDCKSHLGQLKSEYNLQILPVLTAVILRNSDPGQQILSQISGTIIFFPSPFLMYTDSKIYMNYYILA